MEGSGRKSRVYLIEGKRLVQGDPNLVTDNEIMLKPVTVEGKQAYMLVDNKGNVLSSNGGGVVVPATKYLYCTSDSGHYSMSYTESIESASDYVKWVIDSDRLSKTRNMGCISVGGEIPMTEVDSPVRTTLESEGGLAPSAQQVLGYCMNTNYVPEYYGPFLRVCPNAHYGGDYTDSTEWSISSFYPGSSYMANIAYIVDRNNGVIASYKDNFAALRQ